MRLHGARAKGRLKLVVKKKHRRHDCSRLIKTPDWSVKEPNEFSLLLWYYYLNFLDFFLWLWVIAIAFAIAKLNLYSAIKFFATYQRNLYGWVQSVYQRILLNCSTEH